MTPRPLLRSRLLLVLLVLSGEVHGQHAPLPRELPRPIGKGAAAGSLAPTPLSGALGFHLRATGHLRPAPHDASAWAGGGHLGLSLTLWDRAEAGVAWSFQPTGWLKTDQGPIELWLRAGPFYPLSRDRSGFLLAGFVEYAAAPPPFDGGGRLYPATLTAGPILGWRRGSVEAHLSLAYQHGENLDGGALYHGAQLGAAVWLPLVGDLQVGGEGIARTGCAVKSGSTSSPPACPPGVLGVVGVRFLDKYGVGFQAAGGRGWGADLGGWVATAQIAWSVGPGFKRPPPDPNTPPLRPLIEAWIAHKLQQAAQARAQAAAAERARIQAEALAAARRAAAREWAVWPQGVCRAPPRVSVYRAPCLADDMREDEDLVRLLGLRPVAPPLVARPGRALDEALARHRERPPTAPVLQDLLPLPRLPGVAQAPPPVRPPRPPIRFVDPLPGGRGTSVRWVWPGARPGPGAMPRPVSEIPSIGPVPGAEPAPRPAPAAEPVRAAQQPAAPAQRATEPPRGGVYRLVDPETRDTMRSGRSGNLETRERAHKGKEETRDLDFEVYIRTDDKGVQRGAAQEVHEVERPPLDKINDISPRNPKGPRYRAAWEKFKQKHGVQPPGGRAPAPGPAAGAAPPSQLRPAR